MDEKTALLGKPAFCIRTVHIDDAPALAALDKEVVEHSLDATQDVAKGPADKVKAVEASMSPHFRGYYLVADTAAAALSAAAKSGNPVVSGHLDEQTKANLPGGLLGYVIISPYALAPGAPGTRTAYNRTASMFLSTVGEDVLGEELDRQARVALIDEAVTACRGKVTTGGGEKGEKGGEAAQYKILVTDVSYRENVPVLQRRFDILVEQNFEQAGLYKNILQKGDQLLHRAFLQKDL